MNPGPLFIHKAGGQKQVNRNNRKKEIPDNQSNQSTYKEQFEHKKASKTNLKKDSNRSLLHNQQQFLYLLCPHRLGVMEVEV
jgi:hypothetical protein